MALFVRRAAVRIVALLGAPLLIGAMFAYVSSRPVAAEEGVDIGSGLLVLWLLASLGLSLAGVVVEVLRATARRSR